MSSFNYSRSRDTAIRLIRSFGQVAALRKTQPGTGADYDPTPASAVYHQVVLAVVGIVEEAAEGTSIEVGDQEALLSPEALSVQPAYGDHVLLAEPGGPETVTLSNGSSMTGRLYEIRKVGPLSPAGLLVFWTIWIRR